VPVVLFRHVEMHMPGPYTSDGSSGHGAEVVVAATAGTPGGGEGEACPGVSGVPARGMLGFGCPAAGWPAAGWPAAGWPAGCACGWFAGPQAGAAPAGAPYG